MATPVILVEIQPRRAADGVAETVRLAGLGGAYPYHYAGEHWRAGIVAAPTFVCSIDFTGDDLGTNGVPQAAQLEWGSARAADLADMAGYVWEDATVAVRYGAEGSLPPIRLAGKVLSGTVEAGRLKLNLADPAVLLKKPLLTGRYGGTGDLDGPVEWEGKIKRRLWGRVWNVPGEPIDPANNIYSYADPAFALQQFTAVRDKGSPAAALVLLDWQGDAATTLAALRAADAPQGGGVMCPSIACVKWWTQPAGDLCADIRGEIGPGYVETTAEIAERLVQVIGGPTFAAGTIAAAAAARPAPVGWVAADENTQGAEMLDRLLGNSSLLWVLDAAGEIVIREWAWSEPVASAVSHEVRRTKSFRPLATRKLGYRRNELPMARGDLAAIIFTDMVSYLDGQLAEGLQPAEAGSTSGAPSGTVVGDKTADDVASTVKDGGGVADNQVSTGSILDNAVTESNYSVLDLFGASVGTDDDNIWRDFAYLGVPLATTLDNPIGGVDATVMFVLTLLGVRTGGDNDRVSVRIRRGDGVVIDPAEWPNLLFESGGQQAYTIPCFDPDPPVGIVTYTVQVKNLSGHPAWQRGVLVPIRLAK